MLTCLDAKFNRFTVSRSVDEDTSLYYEIYKEVYKRMSANDLLSVHVIEATAHTHTS